MKRVAAGLALALIAWLAIRTIIPPQIPTWERLPPTPTDWNPDISSDTTFATRPFADTFEARRQALFLRHGALSSRDIHAQLIRVHLGYPLGEGAIEGALDYLDRRLDTADFRLVGLLRLLYQFNQAPNIDPTLLGRVRSSILGFKFWPDEPGQDDMCTWTENHFILFSSGAYLAGQLYPDSTFTNSGKSGKEMMETFRPRILRWLDLRYRTGYSEWLSNVYYVEDIAPLLNLIDFSEDEEVANKAAMVLDLTLLDLSLNHYQGTFGSTHGRSYVRHKTDGSRESSASVYRLLFGLNASRTGNMASIALALSPKYRMPEVIYGIATETTLNFVENRQRMGIRIEEAERWGLHRDSLEDGMTFLTLEAYNHPETIGLTFEMFDTYDWWRNAFFAPFAPYRKLVAGLRKTHLAPVVARAWYWDLSRNMRPEVNIYTYRTPDYMLSSAQDWEEGRGGDQQHIWSATLGPQAIVFTTHPARLDGEPPNFWTGSGNLPRVAQVENVALVLYKISTRPGLYVTHELDYSHAWFPKDSFDEVREKSGWVFGRKDSGYVALWSEKPTHWRSEGTFKNRELIAPGRQNIWICELGRAAENGTFDSFVEQIASSEVQGSNLAIRYVSPTQGELTFSWDGPLLRESTPISLSDYPRYANPYVRADFPAGLVEVRRMDDWLLLNYDDGSRTMSGEVK